MAGGAPVTLLDTWASPFGQRCRIALAEKQVEYEYKEENLWEKSELLLNSNPVHKKIPVLLHGDKPVCESLIIVQYIDEVWPRNSSFLPFDPFARAQARFWADFVDKKGMNCIALSFFWFFTALLQVYEAGTRLWKTKGEVLPEWKEEFIEILKTIEAGLGDKTYFAGDSIGFVDIALVPLTTWFYTYEIYGGLNIEEECPKLVAWARRCAARESVAKSLHDHKKIHAFVGILRKSFGLE